MSKRSLSLALVLAVLVVLVAQPIASADILIPDVTNHWAAKSIYLLHDMDIVKGDPDGRVRPDDPITRGEFVALLLRSEDIAATAGSGTATFEDVPATHWAYNYVETAKARGIVNGVDATHFGLTQNVTREQAIAMIMRATAAADTSRYTPEKFSDVDASRWSAQNIAAASSAGVIDPTAPETFRPGEPATRAEVITMLANLLNAELKPDYLPKDTDLIQAAESYEITSADVISAGYPFNWDRVTSQIVGTMRALFDLVKPIYDLGGPLGIKWTFTVPPTFTNAKVVSKSQHYAVVDVDEKMTVKVTQADGSSNSVDTDKRMEYSLRYVDGTWKVFNAIQVPRQ